MVRLHLRVRRALFKPVDVNPSEGEDYEVRTGTSRTTEVTYNNGTISRICDDWTVLANVHCAMNRPWTGSTTLVNS